MSISLQPSIYFYWCPRLRLYRRPLQVWLCWLGRSLHIIHDERHTGE
jgi:hypothetical protein